MTEEILINVTPQETRVAVLAAGQVQELLVERAASRGLVGNIYMGKVARVLPGMQSAFVEIGLERAAFLHVADIWEHRKANGERRAPKPAKPIEKILAEGQPVLVQVLKDPIGTKGARLSTQLSIAGRLLVYLPQDPHIGISQRIEDEAGRAALRERLKELVPADEKGGFIMRTLAEGAERGRAARRHRVPAQALARHPRALAGRAAADAGLPGPVAGAARAARHGVATSTARGAHRFARESPEAGRVRRRPTCRALRGKLEHYTGERPLFDLYNVEEEIEKALARRVDLKSGGTWSSTRPRR